MVGGGASDEDGVGIELNGVSGAVLSSTETSSNGTFGIWLNGAADNIVSSFLSESNGIVGVYLGCNAGGPNGKDSCPSGASRNGNSLIGATSESGYSVVDSNVNFQRYGVAVGLDNLHNDFLTIEGSDNSVDDALDENPNCGNNRWFSNAFSTSSPDKNTTDYCIN
jgi:hypothetical protein